jgi:hypothetical protein
MASILREHENQKKKQKRVKLEKKNPASIWTGGAEVRLFFAAPSFMAVT